MVQLSFNYIAEMLSLWEQRIMTPFFSHLVQLSLSHQTSIFSRIMRTHTHTHTQSDHFTFLCSFLFLFGNQTKKSSISGFDGSNNFFFNILWQKFMCWYRKGNSYSKLQQYSDAVILSVCMFFSFHVYLVSYFCNVIAQENEKNKNK